jgi:hypothetical protein
MPAALEPELYDLNTLSLLRHSYDHYHPMKSYAVTKIITHYNWYHSYAILEGIS